MKILQIFNQYRFRGGEEAWVDGMATLLGDAAEVQELRFHSDDWLGSNAPSLLKQICLIGNNPESRTKLRARVAEFQPDVLLFHNVLPVGSLGLFQEAKSLGIPVWCYTHNFRPFSPGGTLWTGKTVNDAALRGNPWPEILSGAWMGSRIKTAILAWHLHRARKNGLIDCVDRWVAISQFMKDKLSEAGIPTDRISVVRHCWDAGEEVPQQAEGSHYLFLGRLVEEKGVIDLMHGWRIVEETLGDACPHLVIAGDGAEMERMQQMANTLQHVRFVGFISGEEKQTLIRQCRALLVPSIWWEPLGLTAYEAYAASRPVVAARSGALQETVTEGATGWTHEPANPKDLARAILAAESAGQSERQNRGSAARQWLIEHASVGEWKEEFLKNRESK